MTMLNFLLRVALLLGAATTLSACSTIAGMFPDKQKQYRYSSDIPSLEIPPDLTSSTIEGANPVAARKARGAEAEPSDVAEEQAATQPPSAVKRAPAKAPAATLAQSSDDVPLIEIEEPFAEAWNDMSRALGRLEIEVSDQNRSDGVYYVYYGGETKKQEAKGLMSDLLSVFTGDGAKDQEFRIKLEEKDNFTNIYVLDQSGKAVSEGPGFELLKRLHEKLQSLDQPEPEQEAPAREK